MITSAVLTALGLWRVRIHIRTNEIGFYLIGTGGLLIIVAYLSQRTFVFPWYAPLFLIPLLIVAYTASLRLRVLGVIAFIILAIPWLYSMSSAVYSSATNGANYHEFVLNARVRKYIEVGQALYRQYPNATLLTSEIGGLGYGFPGHIIDGAGLVSPGALKYHPMPVPQQRSNGGMGAIPPGFIQEVNPDLIVSYDIFIEAFVKGTFINHYVWIRVPMYIDSDMQIKQNDTLWDGRYLNIFIRKDLVDKAGVGNPPLSASELDTFAVQLFGPSATVAN